MASKAAMSLMMQAPKKKAKAAKAMPIAAPATPAPYKEPSHAEMLKSDMNYSKRNATRNWVEGNISTAKHNQTHARANQVIKGMKVGR
jgi:hypothetical protein